jgi:hypothetical protein
MSPDSNMPTDRPFIVPKTQNRYAVGEADKHRNFYSRILLSIYRYRIVYELGGMSGILAV